jgi:hypothetical protein
MAGSISNEVLAERLDNHIKGDETTHGRLMAEVANARTDVQGLDKRFAVLNATLEPVIEHYMAEHPSKVQFIENIRASGAPPKSKRKPISQEVKVLGALVTFLTLASQALQMWLSSHH